MDEISIVNCEDCGLPYREFGLDAILSDEQWGEIHPEGSEGVLCANCIMKRASLVCNVIVAKVIIMKTKDY